MKIIAAAFSFGIAITALPAMTAGPAAAEVNPPWCVDYPPVGESCTFTSYKQCMLTAFGAGGNCVPNPWYQQSPRGRREQQGSTGRLPSGRR